jgi:uncharacterized membrane-anchored protein YhcB (DUF1043 family)
MDNNMSAIISVIMLTIGFVNGVVVMTIIDAAYSEKLKNRIEQVLDAKFETEKQLDRMRVEVAEERLAKANLLAKLNSIVSEYAGLPPPEGPLERSRAYSDSDSEDEDFDCPTSPNAQ